MWPRMGAKFVSPTTSHWEKYGSTRVNRRHKSEWTRELRTTAEHHYNLVEDHDELASDYSHVSRKVNDRLIHFR